MDELPVVLAMTGASGAAYGVRLLDVLLRAGREVHLTISDSAAIVIQHELGRLISTRVFDPALLTEAPTDRLHYWHCKNLMAGIASGSCQTAGMAITPCSMSTLAALASGVSTNLIHRAADVHLKERRRLILTPRETPLSLVALRNMTALTEAGAIVLPAAPGFYHGPREIGDLVNFIVCRICDLLGVRVNLMRRWGDDDNESEEC